MHKDLGLGMVVGLGLLTWGCGDAQSGQQPGREQAELAEAFREAPPPGGRSEPMVQVFVRLHGPGAAAMVPAGADPATPAVAQTTRRRVEELAAIHAEMQGRLEARGARIIGKLSRLTNALHVKVARGQVATIRRWPEVERVERVVPWRRSLQTTLDIVGAPAVWSGTTPYHGDGIRIGIVDSGIDYYHADFGGTGNAADYINDHPGVVEPGTFPAGRVVAGWDLVGNAYNPDAGWDETTPDDDPVDCGGHGTWVAGVAAGGGVQSDGTAFEGPYDQSLDLASFRVAPGVAPKATLYALKVFGCEGPTFVVNSALERAADPNEDGEFDDRLDVVNLSLGSTFGWHAATDVEVMQNLIGLGTVVVAAAGNAGQTYYSAGAPGAMADPIAAGGVAALPLTLHVDTPGSIADDYMAIEGAFSEPLDNTGAVSGSVVYVEPNLGCDALTNGGQIAGNIALIDRGTCYFVDKFQHALDAGAIGVIVANYENEIFAMGGDSSSTLPGVMISNADGLTIKGELGNGVTATLSATPYPGPGAIRPWWTSSRGPSSIGHILRPDVSAPADSIKSASVGTGTQGNPVSGTSFATPFVAGGVALLLQALPDLTPHEVKALLMASAAPMQDAGSDAPVSWQGAGLMDLPAALEQHVTAAVVSDGGEVSVSFGAHVTDEPVAETRTVTVTNSGSAAVTYDLSLAEGNTLPGVSFTLGADQLTVAADQSETFSLSFTLDPATLGAPGPDPGTPPIVFELPRHHINEAWGRIVLADTDPNGTQSFTLPYHAVVRAAASRSASQSSGCWDGDSGPLEIEMEGSSAHPTPVVSAFELGALHDEDGSSATDPKIAEKDLRAVGIATNAGAAASFDEVRLHFAVAITGQWASPAGSYVAIEVDRDGDDEPDTITVPLALSLDGPYADAFMSATYDYSTCDNPRNLRTCEQSGDSIYANLVAAHVQDTQPFLNGVLVLSALAQDLGLDSSTTAFQYRAISFDELEPWPGLFNVTDWVSYDLEAPGLDTASAAPTEGIPLYEGDEPVTVVLSPDEP
ncbi:MAG: S8 family serine peptidase, partial [Deltaproteobacteria bacterium]|nr:S8 family serine peptidase [Deltaproteobacteria bacterium]